MIALNHLSGLSLICTNLVKDIKVNDGTVWVVIGLPKSVSARVSREINNSSLITKNLEKEST